MSGRRGATGLSCVVLVDKPPGLTSHDVVARIRAATGERRIGHSGTLDPMATGLLIVLVGAATRLERYLVGHDKRYDARIVFGSATDTDDAEGAVVSTAPVSTDIEVEAFARSVLTAFVGSTEQLPPAFSAIKTGGVAAHRIARGGGAPPLVARPVTVYEADLNSIHADEAAWDVSFHVSKGTYVRALARDIGEAAHSVAHLGALRRTAVGAATLADAHTLESVLARAHEGKLPVLATDPVQLLAFPTIVVDPAEVRDGRALPRSRVATGTEGDAVACITDDRLLAIYRISSDGLVAETVFGAGVVR